METVTQSMRHLLNDQLLLQHNNASMPRIKPKTKMIYPWKSEPIQIMNKDT